MYVAYNFTQKKALENTAYEYNARYFYINAALLKCVCVLVVKEGDTCAHEAQTKMRLPKQIHFSVAVKPHNIKLMAQHSTAHTNQKQSTERARVRKTK